MTFIDSGDFGDDTYPKTDSVPLAVSEDPTKWVRAVDWNRYGSALLDLRTSVITLQSSLGGTADGILQTFAPVFDGNVVFDGTLTTLGYVPTSGVYTLDRDLYMRNFTVNGAATVKTAGFRIFCAGIATIDGLLDDRGADASGGAIGTQRAVSSGVLQGGSVPIAGRNGTATAGQSGGTSVTCILLPGVVSNSTANGGVGAGGAGSDGNVPFKGGGGGANVGGSGGGGSGSAIVIPSTNTGASGDLRVLSTGYSLSAARLTHAGAGGSAGGAAIGLSGASGGGGGWIFLSCTALTGSGMISVRGGDGGTSVGTGGGGGGGGAGGICTLVYGTRTGSVTVEYRGGNGGLGVGGGGNGGNGYVGFFIPVNLSNDGT